MPKVLVGVVAVIVILIVAFGIYAAVTYPKVTVTIPVSLTFGGDKVTKSFSQSVLCDKIQVQVSVSNGASLWNAQILNQSQVIWEHSALQGEQTSYKSDWISLPSGSYDFVFDTIGGSLEAQVTVFSKGGFW